MMKSFFFVILLLGISFNVSSQRITAANIKKDTLYVLNGEVLKGGIKNIKPSEVFIINILNRDTLSKYFDDSVNNTIVVIVTKRAAIASYQFKLTRFSVEYQKLITVNKSDKDFDYKINGKLYTAGKDKTTNILYSLKPEDIESVKIDDSMGICLDHTVTVIIKTKASN